MAISAGDRTYLVFGFLLADFPDPWPNRTLWNSPGWTVPSGRVPCSRSVAAILVRADPSLVIKFVTSSCRALLDLDSCFVAPGPQLVAAGHDRDLFCVFPRLHCCGAGFLQLSI